MASWRPREVVDGERDARASRFLQARATAIAKVAARPGAEVAPYFVGEHVDRWLLENA